jgi:hypothetical protein
MVAKGLFFFVAAHHLCVGVTVVEALVTLKTTTSIRGSSPDQVYDFLGIPANWPRIVLSSSDVKGVNLDVNKLAKASSKSTIEEFFGPLSVTWNCVQATNGNRYKSGAKLGFVSPEGVRGLVSDCSMSFEMNEGKGGTTDVELTMEYEPQNVLGLLAIPILTVDNAIALKLALPNAIRQSASESLEKFQRLMGTLYGVAGLAHLADCVVGDSQLLHLAHCPSFWDLPVEGQALALAWSFAGPAAFVLSRTAGLADFGLILYGAVEVGAAAAAQQTYGTAIADASSLTTSDPFVNAIGVQVIVALAWLYSSQKDGTAAAKSL